MPDYAMPRPSWDDLHGKRHFWPNPELEEWIRYAFIDSGPLTNPDHQHLQHASIGFLMAGVQQVVGGQRWLGSCQLGDPGGRPWNRAQRFQQIEDWFNGIPDFIITLDASFLMDCDNVAACAVIEHELYHAGHKKDQWGSPVYDKKTDAPIYWIKPHDVEAHIGEVARYGAWSMSLMDLEKALRDGPKIGRVQLDGICGCGGSFGGRTHSTR